MGAIVGIGAGALLAPLVIALLMSPLANADAPDLTGGDDVVSYTLGPDTFSYDDTTYAIDNYLATTNFDLDI